MTTAVEGERDIKCNSGVKGKQWRNRSEQQSFMGKISDVVPTITLVFKKNTGANKIRMK